MDANCRSVMVTDNSLVLSLEFRVVFIMAGTFVV